MLEIILIGAMLAIYPPEIALPVSEPVMMNASAYCPGSCCNGPYTGTALGTEVKPGVVAVDPRVIPLRSWVWVEGYGLHRAEDTGGAIKGHKIDIAHNTHKEALAHGRTERQVWVFQ